MDTFTPSAMGGKPPGRQLPPLGRPWVRWTLGFGVLLVVSCWLFGYHVGGHRVCGGCKSREHYDRLGFGNPSGEHVEVAQWSRVSRSACHEDLFDASHRHTWMTGQFHISSRRWGITCALGSVRHNAFGRLYEGQEDFRELVRERIRRGEVARETVRTIVEFPARGAERFLEETGHRPEPAEVALAQEKALQMIGAFRETGSDRGGGVYFP